MFEKAKINKNEIEKFLNNFRVNMKNKPFRLIPRDKNIKYLEEMGMTRLNVKNIIKNNLRYNHYYKGPETDEKYPNNNVWIFGYRENGQMIYIKLSDNYDYVAKCLSFHQPEFEMNLPLKNEEDV